MKVHWEQTLARSVENSQTRGLKHKLSITSTCDDTKQLIPNKVLVLKLATCTQKKAKTAVLNQKNHNHTKVHWERAPTLPAESNGWEGGRTGRFIDRRLNW